jgi:threonine/homoserine/homoserine lactone efflux protein
MDWLQLHHTSHYWLYFVLVAGIVAVPGMDMAYALSSSLINGRKAGFAAVAGSIAGGGAHVIMSALGIGLLLQVSTLAFNGLLLAGALYIGWMGYSMLRSPGALSEVADQPEQSAWRTFARAVATCLLNPKAYIFMIAVFPQFLKPQYGSLVVQSLILWLLGAVAQLLIYGSVVLTAAQFRQWLLRSESNQKAVSRVVGLMMIATAVWTLATGWLAV